jgi:hypothetical protein
MKKSFFLLTATALVVIFSFFACSDDKEDLGKAACGIEIPSFGNYCMEFSELSNSGIAQFKADCANDDNGLGGTPLDECEKDGLKCQYTYAKNGKEYDTYFYGSLKTDIEERFGGCPNDPTEVEGL